MRYQFTPRASVAQIDLARARKAADCGGVTNPREAFPIMGGGANGKAWRGTNQPRTLSFSAGSDDLARIVAERYGAGAFVWNITESHYV